MKEQSQNSKLKRAEPMLRADSSSVLRSNVVSTGDAGGGDVVWVINFQLFSRRHSARWREHVKRGTRQHLLAVCVPTLASKKMRSYYDNQRTSNE